MPSAVLRADGCIGSAASPHSQIRSTPNAAAVLMIDPRLNGWLTDSSSRHRLACVARRQDRFSRLTSVGPSCRLMRHPGATGR